MSVLTETNQGTIDYSAIKQRQQAAWASGDYAVVGITLQIVGEQLCEAIDLKIGKAFHDEQVIPSTRAIGCGEQNESYNINADLVASKLG